ncbi:MAG: TonB-dependent receptor, partial [Bacteroidetes bacterium]
NKKGDSQLRALSLFFDGLPNPDTLDQFSNLDLNGWNLGANLTYTEPLGERDRLMLTYEISRQKDESEKRTYDFVEESMAYDALNASLSNVFENKYDAQSLGAGYNWSKGRDLFFMARGKMQWSRLLSDQTFPLPDEINRTYWNFLPMLMLRRNFSKQKNFMIMYRGSTRSPSVEQLQNVVDNSNPVQLTTGNPALDQSVEHRIFARFSNTNTEKSRVFFIFISSSFSDNYIGNATWFTETDHPVFDQIDLEPGARLTRPENLSGYWNHRLFTTWGLPVSAIKTNLNFDLTLSYSKTPGLIDEELNYSKNATAGAGLTLSSNISEKVDFTVSTRSNFNRVVNTLQASSNSKYLSQTTRLKFNWILPGGLVFRNTAEHRFYTGLTDSFNDDYFLWTVGLGKKMFKNQRGELTLSVFDVLKQNQSISRNVTETYIEDLRSKVLQRYAMLTFTYNFRNFSTGKAATAPPRDERRGPPWMHD